MFVLYDHGKQRVPVKVWLEGREELEEECLEQALRLANLPFAFHHVALMPDTHAGYGMPIGGILATDGVIVPNAVGVDIGCGMASLQTNIPAKLLTETMTPSGSLLQLIIGAIMREIPTGFSRHSSPCPCRTLDRTPSSVLLKAPELFPELDAGYYQIGTLGGGNHFIEIQADQDGYVALMLHSGSRNFGYKVCEHFNRKAAELDARWCSAVPAEWNLAFLPADSEEGQQYIAWMKLAQEFAAENRERMLSVVEGLLRALVEKYTGFTQIGERAVLNCHHNYATIEHHFGRDVWVHRKGAIRVREGEWGIVPGAMGSKSYIVRGLGNADSFQSCSHGAGRRMSRKKAMENYQTDDVIRDLREQGVVLGKRKKDDVAEECRWAYKDIDGVMARQGDLVEPVQEFRTLAVVKG